MALNDLADLAHDLLDAVAARMAANGPTVETPDRQFVTVSPEPVTHDPCPQLSVRFARGQRGIADEEDVTIEACASLWTAVFVVEIVRCWPTSSTTPIAVADINDRADRALRDAWLLMVGVADATNEEAWTSRCQSTVLGPVEPIGPSGGAHGIGLTVRAEILGTTPTSAP